MTEDQTKASFNSLREQFLVDGTLPVADKTYVMTMLDILEDVALDIKRMANGIAKATGQ